VAVLDTVLGRIIAPTGAVGFALFAKERGWGLFNMVALPAWLYWFMRESVGNHQFYPETCDMLKESGRISGAGPRNRFQSGLIVAEVALP